MLVTINHHHLLFSRGSTVKNNSFTVAIRSCGKRNRTDCASEALSQEHSAIHSGFRLPKRSNSVRLIVASRQPDFFLLTLSGVGQDRAIQSHRRCQVLERFAESPPKQRHPKEFHRGGVAQALDVPPPQE